MAYESIDKLQNALADGVFQHAKDKKKAAGRALGTLVELITYYTLRSWDLSKYVVIERPLPEYAHPDITHNVEFTLHPILESSGPASVELKLPLTAKKLKKNKALSQYFDDDGELTSQQVLTKARMRKNACVLEEAARGLLVGEVESLSETTAKVALRRMLPRPFAAFECKRVGVEEGTKKGPQTIEKAKQGAYVARAVSSMHKMRGRDGVLMGVLETADGKLLQEPAHTLRSRIIASEDVELLRHFILTVGVVSNHGNWFTAETQNKEMRVLAQSYDWLLFLTDAGLAQFVELLLLNPTPELAPARDAFLSSYKKEEGKKGVNSFTKSKIGEAAHEALHAYFSEHQDSVASWFNVVAPAKGTVEELRAELAVLADKNWTEVYSK